MTLKVALTEFIRERKGCGKGDEYMQRHSSLKGSSGFGEW